MFTGKWDCPWHHCDQCGKQASRMCVECPNSFCQEHTEGNLVEIDGQLYCSDHDDVTEGTSSSCASSVASSDVDEDRENGEAKTKALLKESLDKKRTVPKKESTQNPQGIKKPRKSSDAGSKKGNGAGGEGKNSKKGNSTAVVNSTPVVTPMFDDSDEDQFNDLVIDIPTIPV